MSASRLSLAFPDINSVEHLYVVDTSYYNENIGASCQTVQVLVPGRDTWVQKEFNQKNFTVVFNSSALGLTKRGVRGDLPDGIYEIKYSVAPNDKVWVKYYTFKLDKLKEALNKKRCAYFNQDLSKKEREDGHKTLDEAERYMKVAKAMVEIEGNKEKGIQLYKAADKIIEKLNNTGCKFC